MYLTKIIFNFNSKRVRHGIYNCEWIHRMILEQGFGGITASNARNTLKILYVINGRMMYVQSAVKPNFQQNAEIFAEPPKTIDIDNVKSLVKTGSQIRFQCTCNPTKKTKDEGKRVFLTNEQERADWFSRTLRKVGAEVIVQNQSPEIKIFGLKTDKDSGKEHRIHAKAVTYTGALRVLDSEKLWDAFCNGIGREKAYGCGLLMLMK